MPKTYRNSNDLKNTTLALDDIVVFYFNNVEYIYIVQYKYLKYLNNNENYIIFDILKIINKVEFSNKYYKYVCSGGGWPECKFDDYEALTRLCIKIFEICEELNSK